MKLIDVVTELLLQEVYIFMSKHIFFDVTNTIQECQDGGDKL